MKWIRQDNKQVWYSGDVIEKIKEIAIKQGLKEILDVIENEET